MSRSGGRSEWERQQAAQRRATEQWAREQARLLKEQEKVLRQQHLESQQQAADAKTAAVDRQIAAIDEVLTRILPLAPLSFDRLKVVPKLPSAVAVYVCPVFGGLLGFLRWLTRAYCRVWLAGCEYVRSAMTRAIT